ncbi:hypothetical protein CCL08_01715 [Pseudomonas congelans]|uniref:hypothetical protein n=1 Tax=Pseudomonas congelans TaxID=200452 RepID=UPI000BB9513D|nr:hypothetical protein [Pseudomonas congelans]PBQ22013.1 hypothetical protein CCL08_01715 [Pseudomonas congelans]
MDFWLTVTGMWYSVLNISAASPLLAQLFGIYGLVVGSALILKNAPPKREAIKLLGSAFVLALAFAANTSWTYALAIFVVATLVTELEFLEKLAAMFTNNGQHLATLMGRDRDGIDSAASRAASEVEEANVPIADPGSVGPDIDPTTAVPAEPQPIKPANVMELDTPDQFDLTAVEEAPSKQSGRVKKPMAQSTVSLRTNPYSASRQARWFRLKKYYDSVERALVAENGPFPAGKITSDLVFATSHGKQYADFVVHFHGKVYVISAKQTVNFATLPTVIDATSHAARLYSRIESVEAQPMLVLPSYIQNVARYAHQIQILFYDESLDRFIPRPI